MHSINLSQDQALAYARTLTFLFTINLQAYSVLKESTGLALAAFNEI